MGSQPISELFLNNIDVLPLWVKQVLYLKTRDKLKAELFGFMDILLTDNLIQYYVPQMTFTGKTECDSHEKNLSAEYYAFFKECSEGHNLFEIALANYWTFSQTCSIFVKAIQDEYIQIPKEEVLVTVAEFLAGSTRTGEVLKKLGKINVMQLESAIRIQKDREKQGQPIKMASLMIELGYITDDDIKILLAFKEDAKKRFVMGVGFSLVKPRNEQEAQTLVKGLQKEIKRLDEENRILKNRLRKILNIKE